MTFAFVRGACIARSRKQSEYPSEELHIHSIYIYEFVTLSVCSSEGELGASFEFKDPSPASDGKRTKVEKSMHWATVFVKWYSSECYPPCNHCKIHKKFHMH